MRVGELELVIQAQAKGFDKMDEIIKKTTGGLDKAEKELLALKSTLGGADRASSQYAKATTRLNTAIKAGLVSKKEAARLTKRIGQEFTTANIKAKDLRLNMQKLGKGFGSLGRYPRLA